MNRRGFFLAAAGLAVAPLVPALPVPALTLPPIGSGVTGVTRSATLDGNPLFVGAVGRFDGVKVIERGGDGTLQWSEEDIVELKERGKWPLVFNRVEPMVKPWLV